MNSRNQSKNHSRNQLKLFRKDGVVFGGGNRRTNPTVRRPFSPKCFTHVVMRSGHAKGEHSFLRKQNKYEIKNIIKKASRDFYVEVKRVENVGNHLHLLIRASTREKQSHFFRTISALIARQVTGSRKGKASRMNHFWDARPFTRLVNWGRAYKAVVHYLSLNSLEAIGFSKQMAREYLASFSSE